MYRGLGEIIGRSVTGGLEKMTLLHVWTGKPATAYSFHQLDARFATASAVLHVGAEDPSGNCCADGGLLLEGIAGMYGYYSKKEKTAEQGGGRDGQAGDGTIR